MMSIPKGKKSQSDIDLVKRKLNEEKMEKRQQMKFDMAEKQLVGKMSFVGYLKKKPQTLLQQKEAEKSRLADELQNRRNQEK